MDKNKRKDELLRRFDMNLADFRERLEHLSRSALINMAGRITAVMDVYEYMTKHYNWYDDGEVQYMLLFADPLILLADIWGTYRADISDAEMAGWVVLDGETLLSNYPLTSDTYTFLSGTR